MLYASHIFELKTRNKHIPYYFVIIFTKVSEALLISFPSVFISTETHHGLFYFSKAALSFYKWYQYNEKIFDIF